MVIRRRDIEAWPIVRRHIAVIVDLERLGHSPPFFPSQGESPAHSASFPFSAVPVTDPSGSLQRAASERSPCRSSFCASLTASPSPLQPHRRVSPVAGAPGLGTGAGPSRSAVSSAGAARAGSAYFAEGPTPDGRAASRSFASYAHRNILTTWAPDWSSDDQRAIVVAEDVLERRSKLHRLSTGGDGHLFLREAAHANGAIPSVLDTAVNRICATLPTTSPGPEWPVTEEKCAADVVGLLPGGEHPVMHDGIDGKRNLLVEEMLRYFGETCPALAARCEIAIIGLPSLRPSPIRDHHRSFACERVQLLDLQQEGIPASSRRTGAVSYALRERRSRRTSFTTSTAFWLALYEGR